MLTKQFKGNIYIGLLHIFLYLTLLKIKNLNDSTLIACMLEKYPVLRFSLLYVSSKNSFQVLCELPVVYKDQLVKVQFTSAVTNRFEMVYSKISQIQLVLGHSAMHVLSSYVTYAAEIKPCHV